MWLEAKLAAHGIVICPLGVVRVLYLQHVTRMCASQTVVYDDRQWCSRDEATSSNSHGAQIGGEDGAMAGTQHSRVGGGFGRHGGGAARGGSVSNRGQGATGSGP